MANLLRKAREKKGWGVREASRETGVSAATISKLESGALRNPTLVTLMMLKDGLGIPMKDFATLFAD